MRLSSFIIFISCSLNIIAQTAYNRCGTYDFMQIKEQHSPGYLERVDALFKAAKEHAATQASTRSAIDTVYRIRCVFHIVYTNATENIPDSFIYSQIDILNEDYRRRNADTSKTRGVFKDVAGDAGIEFYLATEDPDGNPTTGITRTQGTPGPLGYLPPPLDDVKNATSGGVNPWPTDRYLNIWVCNILSGFGILGYAFPPDIAPNWPAGSNADSSKQGVVLHYPVVGRLNPNPLDPTVAKGRSATHEIGHYLGLRHIWGDGDCTQDDGIDDTPGASTSQQQSCDTTANTCVDSPVDYPDMIENYMDYSDDRCLNMFTKQQIGIMRSMLQIARSGIADVVVETSIKSVQPTLNFTFYPNPTNGTINLQMPNVRDKYLIRVYNLLGELVHQLETSQPQATIDLAAKGEGIYMLSVQTSDGKTGVLRVVLTGR